MQKQSFTVHWGPDNTGDMLFMEVKHYLISCQEVTIPSQLLLSSFRVRHKSGLDHVIFHYLNLRDVTAETVEIIKLLINVFNSNWQDMIASPTHKEPNQ